MYIRKDRAGSAPGYTWTRSGEAIEVEDGLAEQLLLIPGGGFSIAEAPEPQAEAHAETAPESDGETEPETGEQKKSPGRPKLPRDDKGNIIRN